VSLKGGTSLFSMQMSPVSPCPALLLTVINAQQQNNAISSAAPVGDVVDSDTRWSVSLFNCRCGVLPNIKWFTWPQASPAPFYATIQVDPSCTLW
jgi:hypothetical protein